MLLVRWNGDAVKRMLIRTAKDTMRDAATYMAQRAVDHAPVDTGFMASHIQMVELANDLGFRVISTAFYSGYVEFGSMHGGTWVAPRPFMRMALADTAQHWPSIAAGHRIGSGGTHNPEGFLGTTFTT
jgi:HK97 gp10 family phage protein